MTIIITYYLLIIIIIIITKGHNNYCSVGVMELCLLTLLVLIVFCVILTLVCSLKTCHMFRNHMFIREIWGTFTSFIFLKFWNQDFKKVNLVNLSHISLLKMWLPVLISMLISMYGPTPSRKICVIRFTESALMMMKDAFYLFFKARFVLKIFAFLLKIFGHAGKAAWLKRWISKFIKSPC